MKLATTFLFLLMVLANGFIKAQDLSAFDTVVHYSLINTTVDDQGNYGDIELINTPYQDNDGVYCNGLYIGGFNPDGSIVQTPALIELYDSTFAVQVEFRIDSIPITLAPIILCGASWRYLGMTVSFSGKIMYDINDTSYEVADVDVSPNQWHTATCVYSSKDSTATFWMDGQQVGSRKEALERSDNDNRVSNTNGGSAHTFHGNLRNLKVMSSGDIVSATKPTLIQEIGQIYPNPTADFLTVADVEFTSWTIYNLAGSVSNTGKSRQGKQINVSDLPTGIYILALRNNENEIVTRHRFQKI